MNATDKAKALRLLDDLCSSLSAARQWHAADELRALLSSEDAEPSAENWRQAVVEAVAQNRYAVTTNGWNWIEQRARELAREGKGNG